VAGLAQALEKETDHRLTVARMLADIAAWMEPAVAARLLTQALDNETATDTRVALAEGLVVIAGRLSQAEATDLCGRAIRNLDRADLEDRDRVDSVVASLIQELPSALATQQAVSIIQRRCSTGDRGSWVPMRTGFDNILDAFLSDSSRSQVHRRATAITTAVGLALQGPGTSLPALPVAGELLPCRLSTQELVELLKMPTCYGEVRKVVLKHLGNRYDRNFASHWEFVR
jgi:hypothetical protein